MQKKFQMLFKKKRNWRKYEKYWGYDGTYETGSENEERNEIKIGFRMIFQSKEKTLLDEDIKNSIEEIVYPLLKIDGVSIPGM